jgi:F-type H+-transporting ATPase subunit delta
MQGASRRSLADAKARLGEVLEAGGQDDLGDQLFEVLHLLDGTPPLRRILSDPTVSAERKAALLGSLLGGRISDRAVDVVADLAARRWSNPRDLSDGLEELAVIAIVDRAAAAHRLDDVEDDLFRFGRIVDGTAELRGALTDQALPAERKRELLTGLLGGKVSSETLRLLNELVIYPRGRTFDRGIAEYSRLAAESRRRVVALVRTARPLTDGQRSRLVAALAAKVGKDVTLNVEVDPDVLGGLAVQIGDELIDGTVRSRLDEAHRRFSA